MTDRLDHPETSPEMQAPAGSGPSAAGLPLAGVRVLDFSQVMAGPFSTRMSAVSTSR